MMVGIKNPEKAYEFYSAASAHMTRTDNHGFGYCAVTNEGKMFSERWLDPDWAFCGNPATDNDRKVLDSMKDFVTAGPIEYGLTGVRQIDKISSIICHARLATCDKVFKNVHPFIIDNTALIHNGVIHNSKSLTNKISTCDSEVILNEYIKNKVNENPEKIQEVVDKLMGYFACGVIGKNQNGISYVDIFKDDSAQLYATYLDQADCYVVCTTIDIIMDTVRDLKWDHNNNIYKVTSNKFIRLDAITGEVMANLGFKLGKPTNKKSQGTQTGTTGSESGTGTGKGTDNKSSGWSGQKRPSDFATQEELDDFIDTLTKEQQNDLEDMSFKTRDARIRYLYDQSEYHAM